MPQTREHLAILSLLAVPRLVVALSKRDLASEEWLALVTDEVRALLAGSPWPEAPVVPVSARTGEGLAALRLALREAFAPSPADARTGDLLRLPVDRVFSAAGAGTVVTGTLWSGTAHVDAEVRLEPGGPAARIRALQRHGVPTAAAVPGERVACVLAGPSRTAVERGMTLVSTDAPWRTTTVLRADVSWLAGVVPPGPRTPLRLHLGTREVGARVVARAALATVPDDAGSDSTAAADVPRPVTARLLLDAPVIARAGDRLILRGGTPHATLGGAVVTDPIPPTRRARPHRAAGLDHAARLATWLDEAGDAGLDPTPLPLRLGVPAEAVATILAALADPLVLVAGRLHRQARIAVLADAAVAEVERWHQKQPLDEGVPLARLRTALGVPTPLADAAFAAAATRVELTQGAARRRGWTPSITPAERAALDAIAAQVAAAGLEAPAIADLTALHGPRTPALVRLLVRRGTLVGLPDDRVTTPATVGRAVTRVRELLTPGGWASAGELRERFGVSRKYLIPWLEHLDRLGVTRRDGEGRRTVA